MTALTMLLALSVAEPSNAYAERGPLRLSEGPGPDDAVVETLEWAEGASAVVWATDSGDVLWIEEPVESVFDAR